MSIRLLTALALLFICAGCSGSGQPAGSVPAGYGPAGLPLPLPEATGQPDVLSPSHTTSALVTQEIAGSSFHAKNASSFPSGNAMIMSVGGDLFAWVIYELPNVAADYAPTQLEFEPAESGKDYYVALANYDSGRWQHLPGPFSGENMTSIPDWTDYASPGGSMYFAVILPVGAMGYNRTVVTLQDTRAMPAPTGLSAAALDGAAQLSWDEYSDSRADELRLYRADNELMTDAVLAATLEPDFTARRVSDLTNGQTYYFGLKAYWEDEPLESLFSNIVSVVPEEGISEPGLLSGIWPRRGASMDNSSASAFPGPPSFESFDSVNLAASRPGVANRTTPAIDDNGSVYALSADAVLCKFSADLSTLEWSFAAADNAPSRADFISLPHSPVLDSNGNAFFIAAPDSESNSSSFIFSVDAAGEMNWRFDAGELPDNVDRPIPTPNITAEGILIALIDNLHVLVGIDSEGVEAFRHDYSEQVHVHGDLAISAAGNIEVPVWFSGIGVGELEHWVSVSALDGSPVASHKALGGFENLHGGLPLAGGMHLYGEQDGLMLLDSASGQLHSQKDFGTEVHVTSAPARSLDGEFIFCAHPPYGFSGLGEMRCFTINNGQDPPQIEDRYNRQLNGGSSLTSQPAIDSENTVFMADQGGQLYRITYDETQPVSETNPLIADQQKLAETDSFVYSSFALGNEVAYIISEDNKLYVIWDPLDR